MKKLKCILYVLLIFLLGAASGGLGAHLYYQSRLEKIFHGGAKARQEMLLNRLSKQLDLDDTQRREARAIIEKTHAEMDNIRKQYRPQIQAALEKTRIEMAQILRPEQRKKFDEMVAKYRARHPAAETR